MGLELGKGLDLGLGMGLDLRLELELSLRRDLLLGHELELGPGLGLVLKSELSLRRDRRRSPSATGQQQEKGDDPCPERPDPLPILDVSHCSPPG